MNPDRPSEASAEGAVLAATLPRLHDAALALMRSRKTSPVTVCVSLHEEVLATDLTRAEGEPFRRRFNGFYGVRRNAVWRAAFYRELEALKVSTLPAPDMFVQMLDALTSETGRTEASFVSKAVAVLRPESPIIDSVVRARLSEILHAPRFGGGRAEAVAYYLWLSDLFTATAQTPQAKAWSNRFDKAFAAIPGARSLHLHRKLDFLIWGGRAV